MKNSPRSLVDATLSRADICGDVSMDDVHLTCPALVPFGFPRIFVMQNRTEAIRTTLTELRVHADAAGIRYLRIVVEPTGIYGELFLNIAKSMGFATALVNGEHVAKMRVLIFGDTGKTDRRDAEAIDAVVASGRVIVDRRRSFPEIYELLRNWGSLYQSGEDRLVEAKSRVHRSLRRLFPDFDFSTDFLYGPSGLAIFRATELDPHRIAAYAPGRLFERLRKEGKTLFVATHDLSCVAADFDHAVLINKRVIAFGRPQDVFTEEKLSEAFQRHLFVLPQGTTIVGP